MYEIVSAGDGKIMIMDRRGQIAWYPANVLRSGTPMGFFAYTLFGKPHAAIGPPPPLGATNPKFTWHPGKPVPNTKATPKVAAPPTPTPEATQAAIDQGWERAVIAAYGKVRR